MVNSSLQYHLHCGRSRQGISLVDYISVGRSRSRITLVKVTSFAAVVFRKDADPEVEVFRVDEISFGSFLDGNGYKMYKRAYVTSSFTMPY